MVSALSSTTLSCPSAPTNRDTGWPKSNVTSFQPAFVRVTFAATVLVSPTEALPISDELDTSIRATTPAVSVQIRALMVVSPFSVLNAIGCTDPSAL